MGSNRSLASPLLLWMLLPFGLGACDDGGGDGALTGQRDAGATSCRLNSDCPPGLYCKDRICDYDCRARRDCAPGEICESGACVSAEADMTTPPPDMQMTTDAAPADAAVVQDAGRADVGRFDRGTVPDARVRDAAPPPSCVDLGCGVGFECDAVSGECVPQAGRQPLGGPCQRAFHCQSDMCLSEPNNREQGFCASVCCSEADCPQGFGCLYYNGLRACFPSRLFPTNNFSTSAGGACGGGVNDCRTGLCADNRCLGSCCTDRDCLGAACVWLPTDANSARLACDRPNLLGGPAGSLCNSDLDCQNRVCVAAPEPQGGFAGICVDTCCTHGDCPANLGCGQVLGLGGHIISACVPLERGGFVDGANCQRSEECVSGHCVEGQCRQPCCRDRDFNPACREGERCLPRQTIEGNLMRVCTPPDPVE